MLNQNFKRIRLNRKVVFCGMALLSNSIKKLSFAAWQGYLLLFFIMIINTPLYASQQQEATQPIYFESDTLLYNNEMRLGIYQGHIKLTQGTRVLTANYATSYANKEGQVIKIVAIGKPARYCAQLFPHQPKLIATGNTIYYYPLKDSLAAVGDAEIIQGQNHVKGPQINYDFKNKTIVSPPSKDGHTQILIAPLQSLHS